MRLKHWNQGLDHNPDPFSSPILSLFAPPVSALASFCPCSKFLLHRENLGRRQLQACVVPAQQPKGKGKPFLLQNTWIPRKASDALTGAPSGLNSTKARGGSRCWAHPWGRGLWSCGGQHCPWGAGVGAVGGGAWISSPKGMEAES